MLPIVSINKQNLVFSSLSRLFFYQLCLFVMKLLLIFINHVKFYIIWQMDTKSEFV